MAIYHDIEDRTDSSKPNQGTNISRLPLLLI